MTSDAYQTRPAGACAVCGHPVAGMIVAIEPDPRVECAACADGEPFGVYVKPRLDPDEERWYPDGTHERLGP